jgi:diacylglycerol kinase family enzyme
MIPNGSGNDLCTSIGIMNLNDALDYIVQRTVCQFDTIKVLCDRTDETGIAAKERLKLCRHMDVNGCMSMPAKVNHAAIPYKMCCGKASYQVATMKLACSCNLTPDRFEVELDGVKVTSIN